MKPAENLCCGHFPVTLIRKSTMMKVIRSQLRNLLATLLLLSGLRAQAQSDTELAPCLGMEHTFNLNDYLMSFGGGIESPAYRASAHLNFTFRPGSKRVLVQETENLFYQYRERRYIIALDADKRFALMDGESTDLEVFAGIMGGISIGDYRGTKANAPGGLIYAPRGGFAVSTDFLVARLGYQYLPLRTTSISSHRIYLGFYFNLI